MDSEEQLSDAAFRGDVVALANLLAQDPNILDKHYLKCEDKNVLHVSAMLGNGAFFQAVFHANSCFFHDMCLARDRSGNNPMHLAAIHGKLNILNLINDHDWLYQAATEKTGDGGTILHLCVKHNQLDALRLLLGIFNNPSFQKATNNDGMTILHLAIHHNQEKRRREMIIYLIKNVPKILNVKNANGDTALDLLYKEIGIKVESAVDIPEEMQMAELDREMADILANVDARPGRDVIDRIDGVVIKHRDAMMVVASLIATMAFTAMINPPGGVWQDDLLEGVNPHRVGECVMAKTHPNYYRHLVRANTVAFVSSLSVIITMIRSRSTRIIANTLIVMWISVASIAVVYSISLVVIVPEPVREFRSSFIIAVIMMLVCGCIVFAGTIRWYRMFQTLTDKRKLFFTDIKNIVTEFWL